MNIISNARWVEARGLKKCLASVVSFCANTAAVLLLLIAFTVSAAGDLYAGQAQTGGTADPNDQIVRVLCSIIRLFSGTYGQIFATIAIIAMGFGLLLGKISWGLLLATAIGIGLLVGATTLATTLVGGGAGGTDTVCPENTTPTPGPV